jgi:hypothetical protein
MQQEALDELVRMKSHGLPAPRAVGAVVLPTERDAGIVGCNEVAVRDGYTMGVTAEISADLPGSCERRLAVDHPLDVPQRADEALERAVVSKTGKRVEEPQLAGAVRIHEHRQHLAPEQTREHVDMHEEVGARGDPSRALAQFKGRVTFVSDYGPFVELEPGIEGLLHHSEMPLAQKSADQREIWSVSQEITVRILKVDPVKRRISLGLFSSRRSAYWDG